MKAVGLGHRMNNFPSQLSGGEQQRVSIARAVAKNPKLLLCDEPTGALDYHTGKQVLQILQDMSRNQGATVIIVTHNSALAPIADRVIYMHDARVKKSNVTQIHKIFKRLNIRRGGDCEKEDIKQGYPQFASPVEGTLPFYYAPYDARGVQFGRIESVGSGY